MLSGIPRTCDRKVIQPQSKTLFHKMTLTTPESPGLWGKFSESRPVFSNGPKTPAIPSVGALVLDQRSQLSVSQVKDPMVGFIFASF